MREVPEVPEAPGMPGEERLRRPSAPTRPALLTKPTKPTMPTMPAMLTAPFEWARWFGIGRLVAIAVSVALVGAGATWLLAPPPPPVEASLPRSSAVTTTIANAVAPTVTSVTSATSGASATTGTGRPADIVVHVAGAVHSPGIHRLPAEARVADAVAAAGGPTADAHTDAINLAAVVRDGDRVHVPRTSEGLVVPAGVTSGSSVSSGPGVDPAAPLSINTASADQLDTLPGIGPATAAAIVEHREVNGPFGSIDALADVRGIGPAKLEVLRPHVTL